MSNEYIHISEAVKKYDKTRQTFYNYLHKWLVRSKKINNKTYLHIWDIEELLSEYITTENTEVDEKIVEEIYDDLNSQKNVIEWIHSTLHTVEDSLEKKIENTFEELQQATKQHNTTLNSFQYAIEWLMSRFSHQQQKNRFVLFFFWFIVIHISLLLFFI
jgi:rubrerythrin